MARATVLRKRILLVEDDPPIRNLIRMVLAEGQHTVVEAENGLEALAMFKQQRFDLVLTDVDMPQMPGDQLALEIKRLIPSQPIILMTADRGGVQGIDLASTLILDKPFPLQTLHSAVTDLLSQSPN
jgi:DNA-binding response OmpR family regulator